MSQEKQNSACKNHLQQPPLKATIITSDRRTKPEIARKLYCFITAHRFDKEIVPKSAYSTSKRSWGEHWDVGTQHHVAPPQVKPLLGSTELLQRAFDKLAGVSAAAPPGLTALARLSGN